MKIEGKCEFCHKTGDWEAGLYYDKRKAKERPKDWAGMFPWNKTILPKGVNFSPDSLKKANITTRLACPDCYR